MLKKMCVFSLISLLTFGCSNSSKSNQVIGIYVTPYYNSQPLTINVGEYSRELKTSNPKTLSKLADKIHKKIDEVNIETLYVLAIRLYDAGEKDEAAYWFYTAQFRKNIFGKMQDGEKGGFGSPAFEIPHALQSFNDLSGTWINGYVAGNPENWEQIVRRTMNEGSQMGYIQHAYPSLQFKSEEEQATFVKEFVDFLEGRCQWILENKDEILRQRKENGIEGKY